MRARKYANHKNQLTMCKSDLDNLVTSKVGSNRSVLATLANHISLIGLLPVHAHAVLVREDGNSLEGQLVGGTEDTDGNLAAVGDEDLLEVHDAAVGAQTRVDGVGDVVSLAFGVWGAILVVVGTVGHDGGPVGRRVGRHGCVRERERGRVYVGGSRTAKSRLASTIWLVDDSMPRQVNKNGQWQPAARETRRRRRGGVVGREVVVVLLMGG